MVTPRLVHRYKNRVLLLVTDNCKMYCRHCFRRDFIDKGENDITYSEIDKACFYIQTHPEVEEILISGGDPLTLNIKKLSYLLCTLKKINHNIIIRIGTRVPIVDPNSIEPEILELFTSITSLWISLQINHPDELTKESCAAIKKIQNCGAQILNQSVLIKNLNDNSTILAKLSNKLLINNIKPYYIFQGDLAKGTSHFRVPLKRGLELITELRDLVSGVGMPTYAVDIPGGGGKIPLNKEYIDSEDDNFYYLINSTGFIGRYPKE